MWAPHEDTGDWLAGEVYHVLRSTKLKVAVYCGGLIFTVPLWQLREYREHLADKGKPSEPCPPTIGRPRKIGKTNILTSGDIKGGKA